MERVVARKLAALKGRKRIRGPNEQAKVAVFKQHQPGRAQLTRGK